MAEANIHGGDLTYICVHLPIAVGEQIYHALLRRARWRTYRPAPPVEEQLRALDAPLPAGLFELPPGFDDVFARFDFGPP